MPQMVDEAGNIWEVDAQGNPVAFVGKQGAQAGPVTIGTPNPNKQRGDALDNQYKEAQISKIIADMSKEDAPKLPTGYRMSADGTRAELIPGVAAPGANAKGDPGKAGAYKSVIQQIDRLYELYNQGIGATKGPMGILDYLPTEANAMFDTAGAALGDQGNAAFKVPGMGSVSDADAARFVAANQPASSDRDAAALEKLRALRQRLEANMQAQGLPAPQWNYDLSGKPLQAQQNDQAVAGAVPQQGRDRSNQSAVLFGGPGQDGGGGGFVPYGSTMKTEANPQWKGVNQAVKGMIVAGRSPDEIKAFLNSKGIAGDAARGVDDAINYFRKTGRDNFGVDVEKIQVPMSGFEQFRNNAPQTGVGTAAATALNAGGFGIPQALAGGEGLDYLRQQNPKSAFAGDVAGVIGGTAALGRAGGAVAGKLAPSLLGGGAKAAAGRQLATDVGYGAIYGGTTEGTPQGALTGALTAGIGSGLGMGAGQAIKSAIAPSGGRLAGVMADGARPTLGQRMVNSGGPIGQTINGIEEVFKSYPVLGAAIDASREAGRKSWQGAGFQRALSAIDDRLPNGITEGPEAFKYTRKAFDDTYDKARSGMQFVPDQGYQQEFGQWQQNWLNGGLLDSEGINQVQKAISTRVGSRMRNGVLTGDSYKKAVSDLNSTINNIGKPEVKKALAEYRTVLDGAARRNSDPAAVKLMDKADLGYSQFKPLKEAARRAGSEPGYFTPQGLAAVERQSMGKTNSYLEGDTRLGDYIKQGDNFRDRVPNSGTPERLLTIQGATSPLVGAAGFFSPATLAAAGLTLPYMPIVEKGAKALIAPRGGKAEKIGGIFGSRKAQKALGAAGAGAGVGALPYFGD